MQTQVVNYRSDEIYGMDAVLDDISTFIRPLTSQHRMINDLSNEFEIYRSMPRIEDLTIMLQDMPSVGKKPGRRSNESHSSGTLIDQSGLFMVILPDFARNHLSSALFSVESGSSSASSTGSSCWERRRSFSREESRKPIAVFTCPGTVHESEVRRSVSVQHWVQKRETGLFDTVELVRRISAS
jgi:hypothetical protein